MKDTSHPPPKENNQKALPKNVFCIVKWSTNSLQVSRNSKRLLLKELGCLFYGFG